MDLFQKSYIQDVLGIQHLFIREEKLNSKHDKKTLTLPAIEEPKIIFLMLDSQDLDWSDQHESVFQNIIKAMKTDSLQVWRTPVTEVTILDFLTHLRNRGWKSNVVMMSRSPVISESVSRMGTHHWVEVFSVSEMIKKPEVKRISWQLLQELMKSI